ncbi:Nuclear cap-binding protein subunit 1 [Acipenser ruthenus]|uniref:Nuclear cap-binding protein subunit 1 n=1 Tax=Acipenser ruthenus TaxID=7906 RepID=A0A662YPI6_ACIRT|nr:Nuclear cap-binding protein subunit 1 [Acipenser ruthenus]
MMIDLSLPPVTRLNVTELLLTAFQSQGGQPHKRRRTSEPIEIEDRLESLICRVGEKSTSSLESNLEGLAGVLEADLPNYKNKILRILCTVARLLPEKLTVYSTLVGLLNARNYNFGGEFVESMIRQLKETLKLNLYNEALYLVRFLSDLVNCHVIAAPSMVAMFENFVSVVQEEDGPQVRCDWYVYAVLSSLPWVGKELYEKKDVEMERILNQIESYLNAAQLLSYPGKNKIPLNYHIVEVIFGELFQLPQPPHIDVMYTTLLIELCKLQPGSLPQVLAQATEMMYTRLDTMNTTCIDRFLNWFSHHLSNFQFRWSWDDWSDCLTQDLDKPKPKFVREVLEKSMRLSYHQRIVDIVPANFSALIPTNPIFIYKYMDESSSSLPGYAVTIAISNAIINRSSNDEILTILKDVPNPNQEDDDDEGDSFNPLKIDVFLQTLLHMAAKSFSHSFSALAKFHEVLKILTDSDEGKLHILRVVYEAWRNHPQMISVLIDKMIRTQIVDCAAVANWIFSPDMAHDFTRFYVWEILHSTVRKMNKHVQKIQKELETAKEKLEKQHSRRKDSGDEEEDKNSDEEDGPLEEQIERLQEKVESAQSEQKNLFLVIFQRFIMMLTEHLVRCETGGVDFNTPWYKNCIERLQQIFLMHHLTIQQYMVTLENLLFTAELDHHILTVYRQFCALQM